MRAKNKHELNYKNLNRFRRRILVWIFFSFLLSLSLFVFYTITLKQKRILKIISIIFLVYVKSNKKAININ